MSESSTVDTDASAVGLFTRALAAMYDSESTIATGAEPDALRGAVEIAVRTLSAALWLCVDRVALDAFTTAKTKAAAVVAAELDSVPLPSNVVLIARPCRMDVC